MKRGFIAAVITGAVIVLLAAGTVAAGIYVKDYKEVYPNVSIDGIDVSGRTMAEAQQALTDAGYEENASNIAVTVTFPDNEEMTVSGEAAGVRLEVGAAAELAYSYGRDGSFFSNAWSFLKCLLGSQALTSGGTAQINEEYVRGIVEDYTQAFNQKIMKDAYTITETSIEITKGSGEATADANALYDLVVAAFDESLTSGSPVTVNYSVGTDGGSDIDLQSIYDSIYKEPVSAVYDTGTKQIVEGVTGVSFDVDAARKALDAAQTGATVSIPLILEDPDVTTEELKGTIFADVLAEKTTTVGGTSNRIHNVKLATAAVNGVILNPGETFSYNDTLGERTAAKGYMEAGAYVGGEVVQEIGGGICQVSSTIYCTVLYANLKVVERSNHMFSVSYLPLGIDATVNWGTVDFKFKNNTENPIKIEAYMKDGRLTVRLLGTKTDTNTVKVDSVVISTKDFKTIQKEDPSIAAGTTKNQTDGHKGYVVDTYQYIYDASGNLVKKTFIARSTYRVQDKIVLVPVGTLTPSPSPSEQTADVSPSASVQPSV